MVLIMKMVIILIYYNLNFSLLHLISIHNLNKSLIFFEDYLLNYFVMLKVFLIIIKLIHLFDVQ